MTTNDAEPMTGILTVRRVDHAAREFTYGYMRQAREDGHTWHEIGAAPDLDASIAHCSASLAEAACDDSAGDSDGEHARRYDRTFACLCPRVPGHGQRSGTA